MVLPIELTSAKVREAVLKYAKTEDEDFMLHPERIVTATMSFSEVRPPLALTQSNRFSKIYRTGRISARYRGKPFVKSL